MKKYKILIVMPFILLVLKVQAQSPSHTIDSLYYIAMEKYTEILSKSTSDKDRIVYFEFFTTQHSLGLPKTMNNCKIIVLTDKNRNEVYKENNNHLVVAYLNPIYIEGDELIVPVSRNFGELLPDGRIGLGEGDGANICFKFDCISKKYYFDKIANMLFNLGK